MAANTLMSLLVKLSADTSDFQQAMNDAEGKATKHSSNIVGSLSKIGGAAVLGALAAAGAAAVGLSGFLMMSVKAASEAEGVQSQLEAVLAATGKTTGVTSKQVNDLATSLSMVTKFDDEVIISAGSVLARFDKIGKDTFPAAMQATLDLAQSLGIDLSSAAVMVGKVLQTPGEGMLRLKAAGVALTDEQTNLIQSLFDTGRVAEAQEMILDALKGTMGGVAQAAGKTLSGKLAILKTQFGNILEAVGNKLLPKLTEFATMLSDKLASPEVQAWISNFATKLGDFAAMVIAKIPLVIAWFVQVGDWFKNNQWVIIGALAVLGVAIAAFAVTTAISIGSVVLAAAPILLIIGAIVLVVGLLYKAWTSNWGGIQDKVAAVWAFLQPIFATIITWLQTNIPKAVQFLTDVWNNVLLPAITAVWNFFTAYILPVLQTAADVLVKVVGLAVTALAGLWQNILLPAITLIWAFFTTYILPILKKVSDYIRDEISKKVEALGAVFTILSGILKGAVKSALDWLHDKLLKIQAFLDKFKLPDWLTPGSPTPFEIGLHGINKELNKLMKMKTPNFLRDLKAAGIELPNANVVVGGRGANAGVTSNYNLTVYTNSEVERIVDDFGRVRAWVRG